MTLVAYSNHRFGLAIRIGLLACLALSTGSSAVPQERETWRCETAYGTYDTKDMPISEKTSAISGSINFHSADLGGEWISVAKIGFSDSNIHDGGFHCSGLFVNAVEQGVGVALMVDGRAREILPVGGTFDYPIPFKISIDPNGLLTLQVGKKVVQTDTAILAHPERDTLTMSCSGADVSFLNVNSQ